METARLELQQGHDNGNGNAVARLNGKLSLETVSSFLQTMRKQQAKNLVLNMSGIAFLDSSGVGALVSLFVTGKHAGKTLVLASLTKQAIAVLQVSGILKLIPTYPTGSGGQRARLRLARRPSGMTCEQAVNQADVVADEESEGQTDQAGSSD